MNICITGLDVKKVNIIAQKLAQKLNFDFVDADAKFEREILKRVMYPIAEVEAELNEKEKQMLGELGRLKNCVVCVGADMFLSLANYNVLKNSFTIALQDNLLNETELGVQKLINSKCKAVASSLSEMLNLVTK